MKMKNTVDGKVYDIAQIFRDEIGYFRVLYYDTEKLRWITESIDFFTPID